MNVQKEEIRELLQTLYDSCNEGYDGTWDVSTDEGKKGFIAMSDGVLELARKLEIEIVPYEPPPADGPLP